jgi:hypothetical protein
MVAMAMVALVFVTAFWSQGRGIDMENESKWNTLSALLIQRLISQTLGATESDLKTGMWDLGDSFQGFSLGLEGGLEPFSDLKDLREFRVELKGPIENLTYKTKILLYLKPNK